MTEEKKETLENVPNAALLTIIPIQFEDGDLELQFQFINETIDFLNTHSLTLSIKESGTGTEVISTCNYAEDITRETTEENLTRLKTRVYEFLAFQKVQMALINQNKIAFQMIPNGFMVLFYTGLGKELTLPCFSW